MWVSLTAHSARDAVEKRCVGKVEPHLVGHGEVNVKSNRSTFVILGYCLETSVFTLNRVPSKSVDKTPREMWSVKKPSLYFLNIWGCDAFVK